MFELLVSELVSNAVVYGSGPIRVQLSLVDGSVRLEVSDDGGTSAPHLDVRAFGGWGLRFVDQLGDTWGTEADDTGTSVWVAKATPPEPWWHRDGRPPQSRRIGAPRSCWLPAGSASGPARGPYGSGTRPSHCGSVARAEVAGRSATRR